MTLIRKHTTVDALHQPIPILVSPGYQLRERYIVFFLDDNNNSGTLLSRIL